MAKKTEKEIVIKVTDNGTLKTSTRNVDKLNSAINKNNKHSKNLDRNMKGNARMSSNASKNFSKQAQGMQGVLVPAYAEVAARVFALTAAYTALESAADYAILQKGQAAFAASTGKNMGQIAKVIQKASGYMLDFQAASTSTALASTAGLTAKQIERMTKGARAASVALGRNMTDSMDRLTRGIVKAEPEILDELGVIIRLDTVYKEFALSINKTTAELTEMEKLTARNTAIMGQLESKFGDIAENIPANAFAQLSSSVMDLVRGGGALLANFFTPFISALADSKVLLSALMLLIGKNLIAKVFPFFDGMGSRLDKFADRMGRFKDKMHKLSDSIKTRPKGMKALYAMRDEEVAAATSQLKKMGVDGGTLGGKAFAKAIATEGSVGAALLGKNVISNIRKSITAGRRDIMQYGPTVPGTTARTPGMEGMDLGQINQLAKGLDKVASSVKQIAQATKGTMSVEAVSLFGQFGKAIAGAGESAAGAASNFIKGATAAKSLNSSLGTMNVLKQLFTRKLAGEDQLANTIRDMEEPLRAAATTSAEVVRNFTGMQKVGYLAATALTGLGKALGAVVGFMSAIMMIKWISQELLGLSTAAEKAHSALDDMNKSIGQSIDILSKSRTKSRYIGDSIIGSISNATFKANLAEGLQMALEGATESLNVEVINNAWVGRWIDSIFNVFGVGMQSKLESTIAGALVGMSGAMDGVDFSEMLEKTNIEESLKSQFDRSKVSSINTQAAVATGLSVTSAAAYAATSIAAVAAAPLAVLSLTLVAIGAGLAGLVSGFGALKTSLVNSGKEAAAVVDILGQVNSGILTPALAIEQIEDRLSDLKLTRAELIQTYVNVTEASKHFAEKAKLEEATIKGLTEATANLMRARTAFAKGLVAGGALKDFSTAFEATLKGLQDNIDQINFRSLVAEGLDIGAPKTLSSRWKSLKNEIKQLDDRISETKLNINELSPKEIQSAVKVLENSKLRAATNLGKSEGAFYKIRIGRIKEELLLNKQNIDLSEQALENKAEELLLSRLMGGNATDLYNLHLTQATKLQQLSQDKVHLDQFGTSALQKQAQIKQDILKLELQKLQAGIAHGKYTETERRNVELQMVNLRVQMHQASKTAKDLSKHFNNIAGTTETITQRIVAMQRDNTMRGPAFFYWKSDEINKEFNAFRNSLDETFNEGQKVAGIISAIIEKNEELNSTGLKSSFLKKFAKAFPDEKNFKKTYKWIQLATTAQGKSITRRLEVLNKESADRAIQKEFWHEHEDLLELRKTIATYERDMQEEGLALVKTQLMLKEIAAEKEKTEYDLAVAKRNENLNYFKDAFQSIGSTFEDSISSVVSDFLMKKDIKTDDILATLSQGLADATGDMLGGMAKDLVFGRSGLLGSVTEGMFGQGVADAIFPASDVEKLTQKLADLGQFDESNHLILEEIKRQSKITADTLVKAIGSGKELAVTDKNVQSAVKDINFNISPSPTLVTDIVSKVEVMLEDKLTEQERALTNKLFKTTEEVTTAIEKYQKKQAEVLERRNKGGTYSDKTVSKNWNTNAYTDPNKQFASPTGIKTLDELIQNMKVSVSGNLPNSFNNNNNSGYAFSGFKTQKEGEDAIKAQVTQQMMNLGNSNLGAYPDYYLQDAGQFHYMKSGTTNYGANLGGVSSPDGVNKALFAQGGGIDIGTMLHESIHPVFEKFNKLLDHQSFANYSDTTQINLKQQAEMYLKSSEYLYKTGSKQQSAIVQLLGATEQPAFKATEEYVVRALTQNAMMAKGTKPSDWVPQFIQQAMPEVIKEMDRLSIPQKEESSTLDKIVEKLDELTGFFHDNVSKYQSWNGMGFGQNFGGARAGSGGTGMLSGTGPFQTPIAKSTFARSRKDKSPFDRATEQFGPASNQAYGSMQRSLQVQKIRLQQLEIKALQNRIYKMEGVYKDATRADAIKGGTPEQLARYAELQDMKERQQRLARINGEPGTIKRSILGDKMTQNDSQRPLKARAFLAAEGISTKVLELLSKFKVAGSVITLIIAGLYKGYQNIQGAKNSDMYKEQDKEFQSYKNFGYSDKTVSNQHEVNVEALLGSLDLKTPGLETQTGALEAVIRASNGRDGATKTEIVNPEDIKSDELATSLAQSASSVARQGFQAVVTGGHVDAQALAQSFVSRAAGSLMDSAFNSIDWMDLIGFFFASGGIAKGGFRAFASGGLVKEPTLGLVGEGKYNEAVVPLPDGRSIPVTGGVGGDNNITVNVSIDNDGNAKSETQSGAEGDKARQLGYMVSQAVQAELVEQKRPGGLLSQY